MRHGGIHVYGCESRTRACKHTRAGEFFIKRDVGATAATGEALNFFFFCEKLSRTAICVQGTFHGLAVASLALPYCIYGFSIADAAARRGFSPYFFFMNGDVSLFDMSMRRAREYRLPIKCCWGRLFLKKREASHMTIENIRFSDVDCYSVYKCARITY